MVVRIQEKKKLFNNDIGRKLKHGTKYGIMYGQDFMKESGMSTRSQEMSIQGYTKKRKIKHYEKFKK